MIILRATNLHKTYKLGRVRVPVLHGVDISVREGEWVAILGASGSGKSTLLHLLGGLDRPDRPRRAGENGSALAGEIVYRDRRLGDMSRGELNRYRATNVGFIFQFYHLLPELTVLENVLAAAMVRHGPVGYLEHRSACRAEASRLLKSFGLGDRLGHRSAELSGGERQRVAIARALINRPALLLADEPTGNLDRGTGGQILDAVAAYRAQHRQTMIMVTHDLEVAARADRVVTLLDGVMHAADPDTGHHGPGGITSHLDEDDAEDEGVEDTGSAAKAPTGHETRAELSATGHRRRSDQVPTSGAVIPEPVPGLYQSDGGPVTVQ